MRLTRSWMTLKLDSPGPNRVTLTVEADPFELTPDERSLIAVLADAMHGYRADES